MKTRIRSRLLHACGILLISATAGFGAQMQVEDAPEPGGGSRTHTVTSMAFSFSGIGDLPPCTVGATVITDCEFQNATGVDWTTLELTIDTQDNIGGCLASGFEECSITQATETSPAILYFSGGQGIQNLRVLRVSSSGWTTNTIFSARVNVEPGPGTGVPEPGSIALVLSGIAAVAVLRRRQRT